MFREEPQAFIVLPARSDDRELYDAIQRTLRNHGVGARSILDMPSSFSTFAWVEDGIRQADFVIADVTGANANVMIEVGIALGMGKRLLLLAQERSPDLPPNLAALQIAVYKPGDLASVQKYLELWLRDAISERASSRT